jgi:dTMP kinase
MDLGLSRDMFDSFLQYQSRMRDTFRRLQRHYRFDIIDAERSMDEVNAELRRRIEAVLAGDLTRQPAAG